MPQARRIKVGRAEAGKPDKLHTRRTAIDNSNGDEKGLHDSAELKPHRQAPYFWMGLTLVLFVAVLALFISYMSQSSDRDAEVSEYDLLMLENNRLESEYDGLRSEYSTLLSQYREYETQVNEYRAQIEAYLRRLPEELEGTVSPPYILAKGREMHMVFDDLDGQIEHFKVDSEHLERQTILGWVMREWDIPAMRAEGLTIIADRFIDGKKKVTLRDFGQYLDFRPYVVEESFKTVASKFYEKHDDDESRIREVWNMVTQLDTYSPETTETPRLPLETLLFGGGDCEDLAILTASILKAMSADWTVKLCYLDSENPTEPKSINHVTVHVDTGSYKTFVETTSESEMSPWPKVSGFFYTIE